MLLPRVVNQEIIHLCCTTELHTTQSLSFTCLYFVKEFLISRLYFSLLVRLAHTVNANWTITPLG